MLNGETACPMPPGFYLMDCMEAMKRFPDRFFDLAICDPPYGIGADGFNNGSGASKDKAVYGTAQRLRKNRLNSGGGCAEKPMSESIGLFMGHLAAGAGILCRIDARLSKPDHLGRQLLRPSADTRDHHLGQGAAVGKLLSG